MNAIFWFGLFGPPKMNPQLAERIARDFNAVIAEPELRARLIELGIDPIGGTPMEFTKRIDDDIKQYSDLIKRSNLNLTEE